MPAYSTPTRFDAGSIGEGEERDEGTVGRIGSGRIDIDRGVLLLLLNILTNGSDWNSQNFDETKERGLNGRFPAKGHSVFPPD